MERESSARLRVASKAMTVDDLTDLMKRAPSTAHSMGDLMSPQNPKSRKFEENLWFLDSGLSQAEPLTKHLEALSLVIASREAEIRQYAQKIEITISCMFQHENDQGEYSSRATLSRGWRRSQFPSQLTSTASAETKSASLARCESVHTPPVAFGDSYVE